MSLVGFKARNHPQQRRNPAVDDRGTTWEMFNPLHERYGFTIDVAAQPHNAKLPRFFTPEDDGLAQSWRGERVWCNPPYSDIRPWVEKAHAGAARLVVMLLPANRTEQGWWQEFIEPFRDLDSHAPNFLTIKFLPGRPRFVRVGSETVGPNERPPFGCCLAVWSNVGWENAT